MGLLDRIPDGIKEELSRNVSGLSALMKNGGAEQ